MHLETIKAEIRIRHGSAIRFAEARGLAFNLVHDVLRGRPNRRIEAEIAKELNIPVTIAFPGRGSISRRRKSGENDNRSAQAARHRLTVTSQQTGVQ